MCRRGRNSRTVRRPKEFERTCWCLQLLRKLQRSIATLQTCGEWGGHSRAPDTLKGSAKPNGSAGRPEPAESSLELQTVRIWAQARAPQKQLFDLMVRRPTVLNLGGVLVDLKYWALDFSSLMVCPKVLHLRHPCPGAASGLPCLQSRCQLHLSLGLSSIALCVVG